MPTSFTSYGPVVVSIDLDYFAETAAEDQAPEFERIWSYVSQLPNLRAVTIAISRPYLAHDEQADALLRLALERALSLPTARIYFEPFQKVTNDRSLRAREYRAAQREVPSLTSRNPPRHCGPCSSRTPSASWSAKRQCAGNELLQTWHREAPAFHLSVNNRQPSTDNIWRVPAGEIEVKAEPWYAPIERVQWIAELPLHCAAI